MAFTNIIDIIYPVGSIYQSMTTTSPATLFGGTWVQIKTFLYGQNTIGNTGGVSSNSLTQENLPPVIEMSSTDTWYGDGSSDAIAMASYYSQTTVHISRSFYATLAQGKSSPIDNLPPYTTCLIWQRTQ